MKPFFGLVALLVVLTMPDAAVGQDWGPSGLDVCGPACRATGGSWIVPDGVGGAYIAWRDYRDASSGDDVYLQRITAAGTIASRWPPEGLLVYGPVTSQDPGALVPDGQGGVFVVWTEGRDFATAADLFAQRVLPDASFAPGWPASGAPVSRAPSSQSFPVVAPDGAGGAYFAWMDRRHFGTIDFAAYAQHLTATGDVAHGWPQDGLMLSSYPAAPRGILADQDGGIIVAWTDGRRDTPSEDLFDVYFQRLRPDGSIAPGWTENGVLAIATRSQPKLVPAEGGFYLASALYLDSNAEKYTVQRFTMDGDVFPGWPGEGTVVVGIEPIHREGLVVAGDGLGGILLSWFEARAGSLGYDIWASRVLPSGTLAPGWPLHGLLVSSRGCCSESNVDLCSDGNGGAYIAWEWSRDDGHTAFVQHLAADGSVVPEWSEYGTPVSSGEVSHFIPKVAPDGAGGAIVSWNEGGTRYGVYANHFSPSGPVSTQVTLTSVEASADRIILRWYGSETGAARVERRREKEDWQSIGWAETFGDSELRFEDHSVVPGERYAYRLGYTADGIEQFTEETWVDVPLSATLRLNGFSPNPARGLPMISFSLESSSPALLELFNAAGRRIGSYSVGDRGAGSHLLQLNEDQRLRAGVYWIRLTSGARSLTTKGVVLN